MIGDNIGPLLAKAIAARVRRIIADWWLLAVALACFATALWIGG